MEYRMDRSLPQQRCAHLARHGPGTRHPQYFESCRFCGRHSSIRILDHQRLPAAQQRSGA